MRTQHTEIDKDQEAPPQIPGSFSREPENLPPTTPFPPPRRPSHDKK